MSTLTGRKGTVILGIDPGVARTGYGVVLKKGSSLTALSYGCITTKKETALHLRYLEIYHTVEKIIRKTKPQALALEQLFFAKNVKTALTVSEARGVVLLLAGKHGLPVFEFTPLQVKQALTGFGRADKTQVQKMVKIVLGLQDVPRPDDTADALAIALCAHQYRPLAS